MTLRELSQLYWLKREIEADTARLRELEESAYHAGAAALGGMPRGTGAGRGTEQRAVAIAGLRTGIEEKQARCIQERQRLEAYIAGIDDSLTRQIFTLRFIDGLTWEQVAVKIGGGNTPEGVKKRFYRYLKTHE